MATECGRGLLAKAWTIVQSLYSTEAEFAAAMADTSTVTAVAPTATAVAEAPDNASQKSKTVTPPPMDGDRESVFTATPSKLDGGGANGNLS